MLQPLYEYHKGMRIFIFQLKPPCVVLV